MHERIFYVWIIILIVEVVFSLLAGLFSFHIPKAPNGEPTTSYKNGKTIINAKTIIDPPSALAVLIVLTIGTTYSFLQWYLPTINQDTFICIAISVAIIITAIISMFILFFIYAVIACVKWYLAEKHYAQHHNEDPDNVTIAFQ